MESSQHTKPELLKNCPGDAYTWLIHMSRKEIRPVSRLPRVSVKCTSMILDTVNFSIDYSSPLTPNTFKSSYEAAVSERSLEINSPSQRTASSNSGDQADNLQILKTTCRWDKRSTRSNVRITMQYLGTGFSVTNEIINPKDEVGMFQQICGGENVCVYKGYLSPGETFQFISKRHRGFPFSASVYINGLIAARISSCCEYRYHVGFQQGRRGCFRLTQLSGGKPCYRCTDFQNHKQFHMTPEKIGVKGLDCKGAENDFRADTLKHSTKGLGQLGPRDPGKKNDDLAITRQNNGKPALVPDTTGTFPPPQQRNLHPVQVSSAKQRRRRNKKRVPKEESDSEQENIQSNGDRRSGKSKAHRPKTNHRNSTKTNSQSGNDNESKYSRTKGAHEWLAVKPTLEEDQTARPLDGLEEIQQNGRPAPARSHPSKNAGNTFQEQRLINQENTDTTATDTPRTACDHHPSTLTQTSQEQQQQGTCDWKDVKLTSLPPIPSDRRIRRKLLEAAFAVENITCYDVELSDSSESSENRSASVMKTKDHHNSNSYKEQVGLPVSGLQEVEQNHDFGRSKAEEEETGFDFPEEEEDRDTLSRQVTALVSVLKECDEVTELVLRNTGLTDSLLQLLASAIINTKSQVESINLNLNELGPDGAKTIINLLEKKPCVKSLLLYGNLFGDYGINALMNGISMLYNWGKASVTPAMRPFELTELDIGGNELGAEGLRSVASFLRLNPPIKYLGLAKIIVWSVEAWKEFFESIRDNTNVSHILLDENNLGDDGANLLARALQTNQSLVQLDLDNNDIGDGGGQALAESLSSNTRSLVKYISLEDNLISKETMDRIQTLLTTNLSR